MTKHTKVNSELGRLEIDLNADPVIITPFISMYSHIKHIKYHGHDNILASIISRGNHDVELV